ncbi:hypothetical protein ABNX05_24240 [Lysinibacillus sp. M3]|uniref:DUF4365 domain-containing protein n=1 Tax=Lysinibacillus zambalensis TaxID=3160866 RepID=A0ABV1MYZ8_9BACI
MDNLIIEHLACLEVNRVILQEPYKLVSEVQFNDKSPSFDGEIIIYNSNDLKKENIEDAVKVQIKGTTLFKKIKSNGKITHSIMKSDLENYKRTGKGVLYLVVTINKKNKKMQTFYNSLTPLEIERLLSIIKLKEQDSLSVDFKILKDGDLEYICRAHIKNVRKQPNNFIEMGKKRNYEKYKIEYDVIASELKDFNLLDNVAYVYGVEGDFEYPIEAIIPEIVNINGEETLILFKQEINVKYNITESQDEIKLLVEDTLVFTLSKKHKTGKLMMGKLKTIESYLKCLKVLKYILAENRFPFKLYNIIASLNEKEKYKNIDQEIEQHIELQNICKRIGINSDYRFDDNEDLEKLFNSIHNIFYEKNYKAINNNESESILRLKLSDYITLLLYKDSKDDLYYNIFDENMFNEIDAFIPKNPGEFNPNTDDYYKISLYSNFKIHDLLSLTNFNYEIYEKSFKADAHDKSLEFNNQIALDLISVYDETKDFKFLNLARGLLSGLVETSKENNIYKLNLLQIKKRNTIPFEKYEEEFLLDFLEMDDLQTKFVVQVILGSKTAAERLFKQMSSDEKTDVQEWPIFNLFLEM